MKKFSRSLLCSTAAALSSLLTACLFSADNAAAAPLQTSLASTSATATLDQSALTQSTLDRMAQKVAVAYRVIDNRSNPHCAKEHAHGYCFRAALRFTSQESLSKAGWQLYFSHITPIRQDFSKAFDIQHINGDLHRIVPTPHFQGFQANVPQSIEFIADYWQLSETDPMPNYYFVAENLTPAVVANTRPLIDPETGLERLPFVGEITDVEKQFKRTPQDKSRWATAEEIFRSNADTPLLSAHLDSAIIPTPQQLVLDAQGRYLDLSSGIRLDRSGIAPAQISAALARLESFGISEQVTGVPLQVIVAKNAAPAAKPGSYRLSIQSTHIAVHSGDAAGAANALNSLASLVTLGRLSVPLMDVKDSPRYSFRGLHIDVARNFHSKAVILKILDQMAAYKLNKLHLHLGDDEGWRMEIPGLPELTEIGSKRCHDLEENRCLLPQLGSGPFGDTPVNGYYSVADYQEILRAASARHIQVLPSFDMPGHARAAIKAMEARYRKLQARGETQRARQYLLSDFEDQSEYRSVQNYNDNTVNVCLDSAYAFIEKVIDEMRDIHRQALHPLTRYHIGADETAGAWQASPACQRLVLNQPSLSIPQQLGAYFIERVAAMLASKNIETAAWSDGLEHTNPQKMPATVQSNAWTPLFWNGHQSPHRQANRGWQVIVSSPDATYFDFPYEADPKERGYYWGARYVNTRKVFQFMPENLPVHAEFWNDRNGQPMRLDDRQQRDAQGNIRHQPRHGNRAFRGVQGHLWSETVRTDKQVEYMLFPRLLALSERAWHRAPWEVPYNPKGAVYSRQSNFFTEAMQRQREADWHRFANTLGQKELAKLDLAGLNYRLPTAGATIRQGRLHLNVVFPGLNVEYSEKAGHWAPYSEPLPVNSAVKVRTVSPDNQRRGRALSLNGE